MLLQAHLEMHYQVAHKEKNVHMEDESVELFRSYILTG
jgi:hypothetical protein